MISVKPVTDEDIVSSVCNSKVQKDWMCLILVHGSGLLKFSEVAED